MPDAEPERGTRVLASAWPGRGLRCASQRSSAVGGAPSRSGSIPTPGRRRRCSLAAAT